MRDYDALYPRHSSDISLLWISNNSLQRVMPTKKLSMSSSLYLFFPQQPDALWILFPQLRNFPLKRTNFIFWCSSSQVLCGHIYHKP